MRQLATSALAAAALAALAAPLAAAGYGPEQASLALTANGPSEMSVTWASMRPWDATSAGSVTWWGASGSKSSAPAATWTYTAGFGWNGTVYHATMTGLTAGAWYTYTIESEGNVSAARRFHAAPTAGTAPVKIGVLGDQGTVQLTGFLTAEQIIKEHNGSAPFDMLLIAGDLS